MRLSIVIKARNEAENIARCLESAIAVARRIGGEVILADSCSTDDTVTIAKAYPVRIVQLAVAAEACCGIGPELGFEHARGDYVYLLDGDMVLQFDFVERALAILDSDPRLAGIGGYIREMRATNFEFKRRNARQAKLQSAGPVETECLSGGGLYRRAALESVGYMSDRNLHALEEYDLGTRLRKAGWRLMALPDHAADHYSYDIGTWELLRHRVRGGSFLSQGELLRAASDGGYLLQALSEIRAYRFSFAVIAYWTIAILLAIAVVPPAAILSLAVVGTLVAGAGLGALRRDMRSGFYSILVWHLTAIGLIAGAVRGRRDPREPVECRRIADGVEFTAESLRLDATG